MRRIEGLDALILSKLLGSNGLTKSELVNSVLGSIANGAMPNPRTIDRRIKKLLDAKCLEVKTEPRPTNILFTTEQGREWLVKEAKR